MKFKSQLSVVSLVTAVIALVGAGSASAQDINFTCTGGAGISVGAITKPPTQPAYSATPCSSPGHLFTPAPLISYSYKGVNVTDSGFNYNTNQGDATLGGFGQANQPSLNPAQANTSETVTVTDSNGAGLFTFQSVDLRSNAAGETDYSIQGYDGNTLEFTISDQPKTPGSCTNSVTWIAGTLGPCISLISPPSGSNNGYTTVSAGSESNQDITKLVITMDMLSNNAYLDNIELTSIPEGGAATIYLLFAGAVCFGAMFFKRMGQLTA